MYEGAAILMFEFRQKVMALRRYESLCFTLCITLMIEEQAASKTAEHVLCQLFADQQFWQLSEAERQPYLLKVCTRICFQSKQAAVTRTS